MISADNPSPNHSDLLRQPPEGRNYKVLVELLDQKNLIGISSNQRNIEYNLSIIQSIKSFIDFHTKIELSEGVIEISNLGVYVSLHFQSKSGKRSMLCLHHYKAKVEMNSFITTFVEEKMALTVLKNWLECIRTIVNDHIKPMNFRLVQYQSDLGAQSIDWD